MSEKPFLTIRVSHDSGKTWGKTVKVTSKSETVPLLSSQWPLCRCCRCAAENGLEQ